MIYIFAVNDAETKDLSIVIKRIKDGDSQLRENFIKDYIPFIIKVLSSSSKSRIDIKNSDEYSIGLIAFNEAIEKYDNGRNRKGFNFFSFAELVIKRRVIDHFRLNSKNMETPFSYFEVEGDSFQDKYLQDESWTRYDRIEVFQEIKHYSNELKNFGININDLHKYTPKHRDSIRMCVDIARKIAENKEIYSKLIQKKYFPMKDIIKIVNVHPSTIEKNRRFIISVCIIYGNNYEYLKTYFSSGR
ncbi:MAG: RNA polymerase sigma factor SigI [Firmicutes bacterium ADurb.Bin419]|nr:MAG: RNA polymerase sigma factor SigI [Firmicutes bacterium ADurb.Bin419]